MKQPNILLIVLDCGRADRLSCYGYQRQTTPNLDRIAKEGTLFRNAISAAEWTVPSHASMFTGLMPSQHGAVNLHRYLDPGPPTVAERLRDRGYRTVSLANNAFLTPDTGLTRGFQIADGRVTVTRSKDLYHRALRVARKLQALKNGGDDRGSRLLNSMIRRQIDAGTPESPFFIFINYVETHAPYHWMSQKVRRRYLSPDITDQQIDRIAAQNHRDVIAGTAPMSESDVQVLNAIYDASLSYIDERLGELLSFMQQRNILDDTLLIITADHGDNLGDHGLVHHAYSLHETLIHVPLIVRYPRLFPQGTVIDDIVQTVDIFPTVLDVLGVEEPDLQATFVGESFVPSRLAGRSRRFAVAELTRPFNEFETTHPFFDFTPLDRELRAVRTEDWKYIWASDGRHELYHIAADPNEENNLVSLHADVAAELQQRMADFWSRITPAEWQGAAPELDATIREHLEALGYIE